MGILRVTAAAVLLLWGGPGLADQPLWTEREAIFVRLLQSPDTVDVKLAAKSLNRNPRFTPEMTDLAAEALWASSTGEGAELDVDTQAWLAKALGSFGSQRYLDVLQQVSEKLANEKFDKHLVAVRELLTEPAPAYVPGAMREALKQPPAVTGLPPRCDVAAFVTLAGKQTLDQVLALCGRPTVVTSTLSAGIQETYAWALPARLGGHHLLLDYRDVGAVLFSHTEGDWLVAQRYPRRHADGSEYTTIDRARDDLRHQLSRAVFEAARTLVREQAYDLKTLELAANYLMHHSDARHARSSVHAQTHLCRLLGESENPRYEAFLAQIGEKAGHRAVQRHCRKHADEVPEGVPQYPAPMVEAPI